MQDQPSILPYSLLWSIGKARKKSGGRIRTNRTSTSWCRPPFFPWRPAPACPQAMMPLPGAKSTLHPSLHCCYVMIPLQSQSLGASRAWQPAGCRNHCCARASIERRPAAGKAQRCTGRRSGHVKPCRNRWNCASRKHWTRAQRRRPLNGPMTVAIRTTIEF
jgi:hypothetical protein